jgi:hypothetical protein
MRNGGFDVIVGNPPYVEYHIVKDQYRIINYATADCGNLYAYVLERCFQTTQTGSRIGMIVQLSAICTDRMAPLQQEYVRRCRQIWASCYDDRPGKLFDGLEHIRATIVLSRRGDKHDPQVLTTNLQRWYTESRPSLFALVNYGDISSLLMKGSFPKAGDPKLRSILAKLRMFAKRVEEAYDPRASRCIYYYRSPLYWIRAMDFLPYFKSPTAKRSVHHFKDFPLARVGLASTVGCVINSTLFYIWFVVFGNGRNVAIRDITTFPAPEGLFAETVSHDFRSLFAALMASYQRHSIRKRRRDGVEYQEFCPAKSKDEMDRIDHRLASYYGLTDDELDLVLNYDVRFRLGQDDEEDGDD